MLCFMDSTFCTYYTECAKGKTCRRALTPEVEKRALEWWGKPDPPICVYADKPECLNAKE